MSYGVVVVHKPIRFSTYLYVLLGIIFCLLIFLALGKYSLKSELGFVVRKSGQITYRTDREAMVEKVFFQPGATFKTGDTLLRLKEDGRPEVTYKVDNLRRQLEEQNHNFVRSVNALDAQKHSLEKQIRSTQNDRALYERNVEILAMKQTTSVEKLRKISALVEGRYVTNDAKAQAETEAHQAAYDENNGRLRLRELERQIEELERQLEQIEITRSQTALNRSNAALKLQHDGEKSHAQFEIKAISDGRVSHVLISEGALVKVAMPLIITNKDSNSVEAIDVTLLADSRSIGFLKKGDSVNLRMDAFPYEKYGTLIGEIKSVDVTPTEARALPIVGAEVKQAYSVNVAVNAEQSHFKVPASYILDGMTGRASVKLQTLSLFEWLFLPVIKALNRNPDFGG